MSLHNAIQKELLPDSIVVDVVQSNENHVLYVAVSKASDYWLGHTKIEKTFEGSLFCRLCCYTYFQPRIRSWFSFDKGNFYYICHYSRGLTTLPLNEEAKARIRLYSKMSLNDLCNELNM